MTGDPGSRYSRQTILPEFGEDGQERLARSTVLVVGCGALGSVLADTLTRGGVGHLVILDRDVLELSNLQRQSLFNEQDVTDGLPKAEAAARTLARVNADIRIEGRVTDLTPRNAEALIRDVDLVLDGTDNFEARYLINDVCCKLGKPWVYGGVIGTTGMTMSVVPGSGPCLRCVFPEPPAPGTAPTCDTAGVLNTVPAIIASLQATAAYRILLGHPPESGRLLSLDAWTRRWHELTAPASESCPACVHGRYEFLDAGQTSWTTAFCGRNAVQVSPASELELDLAALKERLDPVATATFNGLVLSLTVEGHELVVFPDGRALIKDTQDESRARALYARYVGM
ncbi:MAG: ThiF family adenylyltransferase [bacterium]